MAEDRPGDPESSEYLDQLMDDRRAKAAAMRGEGENPFANDFEPSIGLGELRERYADRQPAEASGGPVQGIDDQVHRVAGRATAKRVFGKSMFVPISDAAGDMQLFVARDHCEDFDRAKQWLDAGDIVAAEGPVFFTRKGEMSILCKRLRVLTKAIRPLPDKWHGLTDKELRYRQRYLDMAVSRDVRDTFRKRSQILRETRRFLDARDFLEVETPILHSLLGGAAARPFATHHNALDMPLYMRIAPELFLKRLLVGGFERVYEMGRNFRNEGLSRQHNPEFTMLEFYMAYATYHDLMKLTEELVCGLADTVAGGLTIEFDGHTLDLSPPWRRLSVKQAVADVAGKGDQVFEDPDKAAAVARDVGVTDDTIARVRASDAAPRLQAGQLGMEIFEHTAEAQLIQPTFLTEFPLAVSPLARKNEADPDFCDRFELYIAGREIANAFSELNDPDDQRARFEAQVKAKASGQGETMDYDEDYCRALELGMPPAAGQGIGMDRLVMILTGQASIRDVILFPLMRPEKT